MVSLSLPLYLFFLVSEKVEWEMPTRCKSLLVILMISVFVLVNLIMGFLFLKRTLPSAEKRPRRNEQIASCFSLRRNAGILFLDSFLNSSLKRVSLHFSLGRNKKR